MLTEPNSWIVVSYHGDASKLLALMKDAKALVLKVPLSDAVPSGVSLHAISSVFGSADALRVDGFIPEDILCVFFWQACQSDCLRPLKRADVRSDGDSGERCCPSVVL